jgi:predicted DNA-binding transcriptional regulator AlpA
MELAGERERLMMITQKKADANVDCSVEEFVRTKEAAKILKISESLLEKMRGTGNGPPFCKAGPRIVVYQIKDILNWLESKKVKSTSQT